MKRSPYWLDSRAEAQALALHLGPPYRAVCHDPMQGMWGVYRPLQYRDRMWHPPYEAGFIKPTDEQREMAKMLAMIADN